MTSSNDVSIDFYIAMAQRKLIRLNNEKVKFIQAGDEAATSSVELMILQANDTLARLQLAKSAAL